MNRSSMHASLDHLSSTKPKSFSSPKTCTFQTTRIQQWLNLHNSSLTLDLERTCLLMEMSTCPGISTFMVPLFCHLSSTYTQPSNPIHILHQHTSSITCSLPQGMRMYMSSPTETRVYQSADSAIIQDSESDQIPVKFLNAINISGLPVSKMTLKVGCPVMLLRNLSTKDGLCNGTHAIVAILERWVIGVHVI